jgi:hypothetical protein
MSDEVREEVRQDAEQGQSADAIRGQNPSSAAFIVFACDGGGLLGGRNGWGPIFHANLQTERSWRMYVMRHVRLATERAGTVVDFTPVLCAPERKM